MSSFFSMNLKGDSLFRDTRRLKKRSRSSREGSKRRSRTCIFEMQGLFLAGLNFYFLQWEDWNKGKVRRQQEDEYSLYKKDKEVTLEVTFSRHSHLDSPPGISWYFLNSQALHTRYKYAKGTEMHSLPLSVTEARVLNSVQRRHTFSRHSWKTHILPTLIEDTHSPNTHRRHQLM